MPKLLESLWTNYQMEKSSHLNAEERAVLHKVITEENILLGELTAEQKELFENFTSVQGELQCLYEKCAFLSGVRFAIQFLAEGIRND